MIDWQVKVHELKQTADELDLWAAKSDGRQRTVLGRIADELRQFAAQISQELVPPDAQPPAEVPDWLAAIVEPPTDFGGDASSEEVGQGYAGQGYAGQGYAGQGYAEGEDRWVEGEDQWVEGEDVSGE